MGLFLIRALVSRRFWLVAAATVVVICAAVILLHPRTAPPVPTPVASAGAPAPVTAASSEAAPATAPATLAPTTQAQVTQAQVTQAQVTQAAATSAAATQSEAPASSATQAADSQAAQRTVLVLPFMAQDSKDAALAQLGDAVAADVTVALSRNTALSVAVPDGSTEGKDRDTMARALGARYVLTGNVARNGDSTEFSIQMTDAVLGLPVWSGIFEGPSDASPGGRATLVQRIATLTADHIIGKPHG